MVTVDYGRYADAVTAYQRRNRAMAQAMRHLEVGLMAAQNGSADIAAEKIRFAMDILGSARKEGDR